MLRSPVRFRRRRPQVSIVICTLDRRHHLERTLESLRALTYPTFEVVVVEGPSTDGTGSLLDRYDGLIRRGRCPERTVGRSRNIGVDLAAGGIIAFLDDDARPGPDWLDHLVRAFDDPRLGAVGGPVFDVPLDRVEWKVCTSTRLGEVTTDAEGPVDRYLGPGADPFLYLAGCNMAFRRSVIAEVGGFNHQLANSYDDVEICGRVVDRGWGIGYCPPALVVHDRAPSATRGEDRRVHDPSLIVEARAIFVLQQRPADVDAAISTLRAWVDGIEQGIVDEAARGLRSTQDADRARELARAALRRGMELGSGERPEHPVAPPPTESFLPWRG